METILGTVHKLIWSSKEPDNNYKIFRLRLKNNQYEVVSGDFEELIEGADLEVHGDYVDHPKYGKGFKAKAHTFVLNKGSTYSISLYIQSIAKFMGPKRSYAIASAFGDQLEEIIEKDPNRLLEVEDVGPAVAKNLVTAWHEHREEKNVRIFLHSLGLTDNNIKRILNSFGIEAENKIKENPYLLSLVGFGFSTCDFIARKLNFSPLNPLRLKYFIIWALKESLNNGHLYLYDHQILKMFNNYNEKTNFKFKKSEIVFEDISQELEILLSQGYILKEDDRYYEIECFFFENESARLLTKILEEKDNCFGFRDLDVEDYIANFEKEQKEKTGIADFGLSDDQKEAIRSFIKEKVLIITGCPGTGKTTIVKAFVELLIKNHVSFELLTPTGIAAKKLGNTAEYEAYTIHRRLGYQGNSWGYDVHNRYETDVVIVDEMSMVDMEVFYRLVSALYSSTKIVLVGDNDQLPSVGPGRVLNELIQSGVFHTIFLRNIFRQSEQSDIIKEAKKIRDGDTDLDLLSDKKENDIWFIRNAHNGWIEEKIVEFSKDLKNRIKASDTKKTFQIITPRNSGPLSVETLNIAIQDALNPKKENEKELKLNTCVLRKGDRVLIKKNNYQLDVYNGDIGKIVGITNSEVIIDVDDYESVKEIRVPYEQAEEMLKLAYSITVHKSQGTEYDIVILPIVKSHGKRILQRNLLYTAITRAKKKVILFGQGAAVVDAIENDKIQDRNTKLGDRVKAWKNNSGTSLQQLYTNISDFQNADCLKRLLYSEEKASLEHHTTNPSSDVGNIQNQDNTNKKPVLFSTPSSSPSLEKTLQELDEMMKEMAEKQNHL